MAKTCDLFEHEIYAEEVADVLCVAMAELPQFLAPVVVVQALTRRLSDPSQLVCRIVANFPQCFMNGTHPIFGVLKNSILERT
jgi:integrator complex subunit 2